MSFFPWKVFWRSFFLHWVPFNVIYLILLYWLGRRSDLNPWEWLQALGFGVLASTAISAFGAYRIARPIQRTLYFAVKLANRKQVEGLEEPSRDLFDEEVGEYSELEHALHRIGKKLRKHKGQLTRERQENAAFMASVQEGLISVNQDEKVLFFNSRLAAQFIHPSLVQRKDLTLSEIFREPEVYSAFKEALISKRNFQKTVKMNTLLDSQSKYFAISLTPLKYENQDGPYGVIGVFHDISEIKKLEQVRIDFVANASHELRTPLTSVKGYLDTIKIDLAEKRYDSLGPFLDTVLRNVDRLIDLVQDLLTLSTLDSQPELKLSSLHPLKLTEEVFFELELLARNKNQVLKVSSQCDVFTADESKVGQVLRNLLLNAIKYVPEGKTIEVKWECFSKETHVIGDLGLDLDGPHILLRVSDDGLGIPEEHLPRLFERFYRIDRGRSRELGGTGLGLAIVKHIMQAHGGQVTVRSTVGQGSEFLCAFPQRGLTEKLIFGRSRTHEKDFR